ncbi:MAG: nuclear transport factor 2 family protein [Actinomycetia bacterium]|nr:nuclear transport factor 2 family protein [Actinomycetes bacterium]
MAAVNPLSISPYVATTGPEPHVSVPDDARAEVERLIFVYSYCWDGRDPEATAALFTDDAVVEFYLDGAAEATHGTVGREALLEGMVKRTKMLELWRIETRHLMMNTVFGPTHDDGLVQAVSTAMIFWQRLPEDPRPLPIQTGYYRSWCVDTPEGWRFRRRETHMLGIFHPRFVYSGP